jgi:hypothetical protein
LHLIDQIIIIALENPHWKQSIKAKDPKCKQKIIQITLKSFCWPTICSWEKNMEKMRKASLSSQV